MCACEGPETRFTGRRSGAHGTSRRSRERRATQMLAQPISARRKLRWLLGAGSSETAMRIGSAAALRGRGAGGAERRKCLREPRFQSAEQLVRPLDIVTLERGA